MTRADPIFEDLWRPSPVHSPTATSPLQSPGIKTPHPLEESLLPLSPDELRRRLALPETLNFDKRDKRTSTGHIFSAPLPVHTEPTSPAAGYFTYPANNSPEEHQHHFERVKSLDNDKLDKVTTRPKKPKRAQTAAMAAPGGVNGTERAKLPLPRNLLFIDNQLTPNTDLTADPMARAGAALGSEPPSAGSDTPEGGLTPTGEIPPSQAPVPQPTRVGKIGDFEASLPKVNAEPSEYYGGQQVASRARTFSTAGTAGYSRGRPLQMDGEAIGRNRRLSHDEISASAPRRFLVDVEETMRIVLEQEDTDANFQISIYDSGPKLISLGTASSNQHKSFDIRGTYMLSNLLQELALARDYGRKRIVLDEARLAENPVDRLSRMIKNSFWNALTRRIDAEGLEVACADPKNRSRHSKSRIYVPAGEDDQLEYYKKISADKPNLNLEVIQLPPKCDDPAYVKSLNEEPGILALAVERKVDPKTGEKKLEPLPFIVPGARFNEMYYWDSYFMALGLLVDDRIDLAMSVVENFIFQIKHYNKVLNGNRTYYLCRSQPPFLTDLAVQIFNQHHDRETLKPWLKRAIQAAIKEYHCYWMQEPSLDIKSGLSRYRPVGQGIPPETEASHFTHILEPYAKKLGISVNDYIEGYNERKILEPELDEYFVHDRGVRESGHDTSYRLDRRCADLATVDLNSLLYKYESDIYMAIEQFFGGELDMEDEFDLSPWPITAENFAEGAKRESSTSRTQKAEEWRVRMETRKATMNELCWNEGRGMFFDWDTKAGKQARYESVTCMWPLWAGHASEDQAMKMVNMALPKFEVAGGLVSGTEESRGIISIDRPNRQWDYPFSWPPHQIMTWVGLERYGHDTHAARLAYRWIYMMTLSFVDFNGIVPEKFDAVELSHMVDAEYGNQGTDFRYVPREGFGWMNAAYQVGLQFLSIGMRRAVAACVPPWVFFNLPAPDFPSARRRRAEREKQEEDAAAHGHGGQPKKQVHHEPPSLEQAIANLKIDLGATKA